MVALGAMLFGTALAHAQPAPSAFEWPTLAGDQARTATRTTTVTSFAPPRWTLSQTSAGQPIRFMGPAAVAATALPAPRVFTQGTIASQSYAIAVDAETGQIAWLTPVPAPISNSWSSPTIDAASGTVLFATGSSVIALRQSDGSQAWRVDLAGAPVNVAPLVTRDLAPRNRAFVTGYGGFGGMSFLTCINISPRHETLNPFDPGDVLWSTPIGSADGATPAYLGGVVYTCSTGLDLLGFGEIRAFDARAAAAPTPLWTFTNPIAEGFFGGLTVRETATDAFLYAATYAFTGGVNSANLVKLNARTGALVWSTPCNRTSSIPIVLADGRIALAGGIVGFGSAPTVQLFQDHGLSATHLWTSAIATWNDLNANGALDLGEYLLLGGWTTHPLVAHARTPGATPRLLVGSIPTSGDFFGSYTELFELDLSRLPSDPQFITQRTTTAGSSPAMLGAGTYSVGTGGLRALGPPPPRPDLDADFHVSVDDLAAWERSQGQRDIDRSGLINAADRELLLQDLRRNEHRNLLRGRR